MPPAPVALSPEWWRDRLYKQLLDRQKTLERWDSYYCGDHPLPWLPSQAKDEFRRILRMSRSNYMGLVVDATAERLQIDGFRFVLDLDQPAADLGVEADPEGTDAEAWRIWQANDLDAEADAGLLEAVMLGSSYTLVAPDPADPTTPLVTFEHPSQAIVEYEPGSRRRRRAGLKAWRDDWSGRLFATLFEGGWVWKWSAAWRDGVPVEALRWEERQPDGEQWPAPNPLGEVPLVEWPNRRRMLGGGVSEIADVTDAQDRINKTLADRLMTQDFGAFPQKWATGVDLDAKFHAGRNRMFQSEAVDAKFGDFTTAPIDPYSKAKVEDVKDIASRTRTPSQYLLGEMLNISGEAMKAAESGLVAKVQQRQRPYSEAAETTMRLAFRAIGDDRRAQATSAETVWRNPEFRTEGELVDALTKMATLGVPQEALWERWGATPQERARWRRMRDDAVTRAGAGDLAAIIAGTERAGVPGGFVPGV
jgi:hypothetical protein